MFLLPSNCPILVNLPIPCYDIFTMLNIDASLTPILPA